MSEIENELEIPVQDELATLKNRADMLGIKYHPSIGLDKLREKVLATMAGVSIVDELPTVAVTTTVVMPKVESVSEMRTRMSNEATALIRIRLTCMNPSKKEWDGEIFTVGNDTIGSIKRYIPFNADDGWHVPNIMLGMLRDRQCQVFTTERTKNGVSIRKGKLVKEFSIEILPSLTQIELNELARRQAMAAGTEV